MTQDKSDSSYDLKSVQMPYLSGRSLRLIVSLLESPLRGLLVPNLLKSAGVTWLRQQVFDEDPTFQPIAYDGTLATKASSMPVADLPRSPLSWGRAFFFPRPSITRKLTSRNKRTRWKWQNGCWQRSRRGMMQTHPCAP